MKSQYNVENFQNASVRKTGLETKFLDSKVRVQDDLFKHVNGKWLKDFVIPADRARDGAFRKLVDDSEVAVKKIIDRSLKSPKNELEKKIGSLFESFMDIEKLNILNVKPLEKQLNAIENIKNTKDLIENIGKIQLHGGQGFISYYVDTDSGNSNRNLLHLTQSGLGLPDETYYLDDKNIGIQTAYKNHLLTMLDFIIPEQSTLDSADKIYNVEYKIAEGYWNSVKRRDADLTYNLTNLQTIELDYPNLEFSKWFDSLEIELKDVQELVLRQPSFFQNLNKIIKSIPLEDWKLWLKWKYFTSNVGVLTEEIAKASFEFYGTILTGAEEIRLRWRRGVSLVENSLGFAVGEIYVKELFPESTKTKMDQLVKNLVKAYEISIKKLEWMSEETKVKALEKLSKFTPKIGYPDKKIDYSSLKISNSALFENMKNVSYFLHKREIDKLSKPVDRSEWFMTPQTVNAYYNPGWNEIVFPAAILQPPFFNPSVEDAVNYGAIGAVIGHEIGHGFDDQGAKYDGDGNLQNWWSESDLREFQKRTADLIKQYDDLSPEGLAEENKVNGSLTIGENIGDLGGLSISILAYKLSLNGKEPEIIDGLTGMQRLFLSWAAVWRSKSRPEEAIRLLTIDPHSPGEFRCNQVVKNIDEFYEAFDVKKEDRLFLEKAKRVKIW